MKNTKDTYSRDFAVFTRMAVAVLAAGLTAAFAQGQTNLLKNGDYATDLSNWKTEGDVTGGMGKATLTESGAEPVLYQPVDVSGTNAYAYELRLDLYIGSMSSSSGAGEPDRGRLSVLGGPSTASLTPGSASEEIVLLEVSAAGLISIAENISGVPNAALGPDWYSVVVEFVSDYPALAPLGIVLNNNGSADSSLVVADIRLYALNRGRLANISNRGPVGTGASIMIPGFVIVGTTKKDLVLRGVGPTLGGFGVAGTIEDPTIGLFVSGSTSPVESNNDWGDGNNVQELKDAFAQVGAFPLEDGSRDAALLIKQIDPGVYTVQVAGVSGVTGVGLAEVYDVSSAADGPTELTNISNRGFVGTGSAVQIPGFVIAGTRGKKVLVRAVGPTLAGFGVAGALEDPILQLFRQGTEGALMDNDNWEDNPNAAEIAATAQLVGAFALDTGSADSALLTALEPGSYTVVARGVGGGTGVALVEVYMVIANRRPVPFNNTLYVNSSQANTLDMDEILGNDVDPDGDLLAVKTFSDPTEGTGTLVMNDMDELVFTGPIGFFGESVFSYTVTDGEFESVPATVALQVAPANSSIWVGGSSGNFSDPNNWRNGEVPGTNDPVWIGMQGEHTISISEDVTVASIRAGATGSMITLKVNSGRTLTAAGGVRIQPGSVLEINNGTVATNQDVLVLGKLVWNGGEMKGNSATVIAVDGYAELSSGQMRLTGNHRFINRGMVTQTGSAYLYASGGSNSTVTNAETGTWDLLSNNGTTFAYNDGSSVMSFVNAGGLTKNTTTGIVYFGTTSGTSNFTNAPTGNLNVTGGTLYFNGIGAGSHSGTLGVASGAVVQFARGTHMFESGATISDIGEILVSGSSVILSDAAEFESLRITGGTLTLNGTLTVKTFTQTGGTLAGDDDLTVTESLTWNSGFQTGEGTTIVGPDATGSTTSSFAYLRGGRGFMNQGEMTQGGGAVLYADQGSQSTITNAEGATWNLASNNGTTFSYQDGSSSINWVNDGTLVKSNTTGIVYFGTSGGTSNFTNNGTLSILGGTFQFNGGGAGTHDGDLLIATGAVALFNRGTHTFDGSATITEEGEVHIAGNTLVILPDAFTFESLRISNGTLRAAGAVTVTTFTQTNGVYDSAEDLTVTDAFTWNAGTQKGAGTTIIGASATGASSGNQLRLEGGRKIMNLGEYTQSAGSYFYAGGGSQSGVTNAVDATWNLNSNNGTTFAYQDGSSALAWVNQGAMVKTNTTGIIYFGTSSGTSSFTNDGSVTISGGTLQWNGSGLVNHNGSLVIASGATSLFARGTHVFGSEAIITDTGTVQLSGNAVVTIPGDVTFEALTVSNGTLNANGTVTVASFSQGAGVVNGTGTLAVTSTFSWTGGKQTGTGTTVIGSEATGTVTAGQLRLEGGRDFTNNGEFSQSGSAYFYSGGGSQSTVTNAVGADWNLTVNNGTTFAYNDGSSTMDFINLGTLAKANASGLVYFGTSSGSSKFTSSGTFSIAGGTFLMNGSGIGTFSGSVSIGATGELRFDRGVHTFASGTQISGDGLFLLYGSTATVTLTDGYTLKQLMIRNGVLSAGGAMTVENFSQISGTFSSSADLTVTGTYSFAGGTGTHNGTGTTILGSSATGTFSSGNFYLTGNRAFINNGTLTQSGSTNIRSMSGSNSSITNAGGATWTLASNNNTTFVYNDNSSTITFNNNGDLIKTSSGRVYFGTSSGSANLVNNGNLDVSSGWLRFQSASKATFSNASVLTIAISTTQRGIEGDGEPLVFGGSLVLKATITPPTGLAIRIIDYDTRNGSTFATITPPQNLTVQNTNYDDTANNGRLEVTF